MSDENVTYALVENGVVVNTILWNGDTDSWQPPTGQIAVLVKPQDGPVSIGWSYNGTTFTPSEGWDTLAAPPSE
jgi:hypothetical protein